MTRTVPLVALALATASAHATVSVPLTLRQLATESDAVVHGRVLAQESTWDVTSGKIYTHSRVQVVRSLLGKVSDPEIMVRQLGGQVGKVAMQLSGNASLKVGEEVVLFLSRDASYHYVVGLAQGKFAVNVDEQGRKVLTRDLSGLSFATWDARGRMHIGKRWELERPLTFAQLEAELKAVNLVGR
jgi:hypothetical protein